MIKRMDSVGIIGGSDSFTIIGSSGIGKSSAIEKSIGLLTENAIIQDDELIGNVIPCLVVQCPFDSSVKVCFWKFSEKQMRCLKRIIMSQLKNQDIRQQMF